MTSDLINGAICAIGLAITGSIAPHIQNNSEIPHIVMQLVQLLAWIGAIVVAIITIVKFLKENK